MLRKGEWSPPPGNGPFFLCRVMFTTSELSRGSAGIAYSSTLHSSTDFVVTTIFVSPPGRRGSKQTGSDDEAPFAVYQNKYKPPIF